MCELEGFLEIELFLKCLSSGECKIPPTVSREILKSSEKPGWSIVPERTACGTCRVLPLPIRMTAITSPYKHLCRACSAHRAQISDSQAPGPEGMRKQVIGANHRLPNVCLARGSSDVEASWPLAGCSETEYEAV
jgi:hypothetical protein